MTLHTVKLISEVPPPNRRDGVRWIVLECDPRDTGGVFLYLHETLDSEAVFDEWYENIQQAKSSAEDLWGVPGASWKAAPE
jgi:hypothetical protein